MSAFCPTCQNLMLNPARHVCPPCWFVKFADEADIAASQVHTYTAEEAVERFAARYAASENTTNEVEVWQAEKPAERQQFYVTSEITITYHVTRSKEFAPGE